MKQSNNDLSLLITDIEDRLGRGMRTPKDFEFLRNAIEVQLNEYVSTSTLKRIWGYTKYLSNPSTSVLSILCRMVGYRDWDYYRENRYGSNKAPSGTVLSDSIMVARDLKVGDRVRLTWNPQRVCDVVYQGNHNFEVIASRNTGIKVGDWLSCSLIVAGEPLFISNLRQHGQPAVAYVCGKLGGVYFSRIIDEPENKQVK